MRIDLSEFDAKLYPEGWVEIKDGRTLGEKKRLESAAAKRISTTKAEIEKGEDGSTFQEIDWNAISTVLFEISVESWSLPQACTAEEFLKLDEHLGEWLEDEIQDYHKGRAKAAEERRKGRSGTQEASADEPAEEPGQ